LFHFGPAENLKRAVQEILTRPEIEGVALTGDLARLEGKGNDYVLLQEILTPLKKRAPLLLVLGNHDSREKLAQIIPQTDGAIQPVDGKRVLVEEGRDCTLVALDSNKGVHMDAGELGDAQKAWLGEFLKKDTTGKPVLLLVHHTPKDLPDLLEIARPAAQVKAIVFGHSHACAYTHQDGLHLVNLPAMGYSFAEKEPVGWVEAALGKEEGVFTLHVAAGGRARDGEIHRLRWR
jgi:3',5'-cyclic AMP phosphodiesterase CpdA